MNVMIKQGIIQNQSTSTGPNEYSLELKATGNYTEIDQLREQLNILLSARKEG